MRACRSDGRPPSAPRRWPRHRRCHRRGSYSFFDPLRCPSCPPLCSVVCAGPSLPALAPCSPKMRAVCRIEFRAGMTDFPFARRSRTNRRRSDPGPSLPLSPRTLLAPFESFRHVLKAAQARETGRQTTDLSRLLSAGAISAVPEYFRLTRYLVTYA